jgi:hypothetical protein
MLLMNSSSSINTGISNEPAQSSKPYSSFALCRFVSDSSVDEGEFIWDRTIHPLSFPMLLGNAR